MKKIEGRVATETAELSMTGSWGGYSIGTYNNKMEFCPETDKTRNCILWHWWPIGEDYDESWDVEEEIICLTIDGKRITDYDGVMVFPSLAVELMESLGYDCEDVKC